MIEGAKYLQNILEKKGYKTLACGGFVRDYLMGRDWNDIDLATTAAPEEVEGILLGENVYTIPIGNKFGTIAALAPGPDGKMYQYEITTLRKDLICDGRHAEVEFTDSFEEDCKRRDFTINALYMDLNTNKIFDYVDGKKDIKTKTIKFVGDPEIRIREDFLRVLRLFRFKSQIVDCKVERKSLKESYKYLNYIHFCSIERIKVELFKMIVGDNFKEVATHDRDILFEIIPALRPTDLCTQNCKHHYDTVYFHTIDGIMSLINKKDPVLSLAFLLHDIGKPFCKTTDDNGIDHFYSHQKVGAWLFVRKISHELRLSNEDSKRIQFIIENHMKLHLIDHKKAIRRFIHKCNEFGPTAINDMKAILYADYSGMRQEFMDECKKKIKTVKEIVKEIKHNPKVESPLSGNDIMEMGVDPGPEIGEIKDMLKKKVIDQELDPTNKKEAEEQVRKFRRDKKNER